MKRLRHRQDDSMGMDLKELNSLSFQYFEGRDNWIALNTKFLEPWNYLLCFEEIKKNIIMI